MLKLKEKILIQQLYRFVIVGLLNTTLNYSVFYFLFIVGLDYRVSGIAAFIAGGILSFFLNGAWTFNSSSKDKTIIKKYILAQVMSLVVHSISQITAVELLLVHEHISQLIGIMVSMIFNFICLKFFVFAR
jgi:putative flippase GtrA